MKTAFYSLILSVCVFLAARGDLTIAYSTTVQPASHAQVLAQLQSIKSEFWDAANTKMPDFRDFPGLPIRMQIIVGKENQPGEHGAAPAHPTEITSTVTRVSLDSIPDSQFSVPADFKETKLPNIFNKAAIPSASPSP